MKISFSQYSDFQNLTDINLNLTGWPGF